MRSETSIPIDGAELPAFLEAPDGARMLVIFAHGSGSSRHSSRNRFVARFLNDRALATLLLDLLTPKEETLDATTARFRFDIALLARRVDRATAWCVAQPELRKLAIGYFGASTGAAAALLAASERSDVRAVVSRGGRPDLAAAALGNVRAPTLLLVGENDPVVLDLNRQAQARIPALCELVVVPGAGHLFEEPGALERVAERAAAWFEAHR